MSITLPFAVIVLRPYFLTVPEDLEHAAMLDGASRLRAFVRVILPLVWPGLVTVAAFSFLMESLYSPCRSISMSGSSRSPLRSTHFPGNTALDGTT